MKEISKVKLKTESGITYCGFGPNKEDQTKELPMGDPIVVDVPHGKILYAHNPEGWYTSVIVETRNI